MRKGASNMQIKLYSQVGCCMCKALHMQLDKLNVEYEEIVIDDTNRQELFNSGIKSTPTLVVDEETFVGTTIKEGVAKIRASLGR